jgi:hypothetical protein
VIHTRRAGEIRGCLCFGSGWVRGDLLRTARGAAYTRADEEDAWDTSILCGEVGVDHAVAVTVASR